MVLLGCWAGAGAGAAAAVAPGDPGVPAAAATWPPEAPATAAAAAYTCAAWPCACATTASRKRKSSGPQRPRIYKHRASSSCCPNGSWRARGDCSSLACPCVLLTGPAGMQQQAPHHHPGLRCCCHLTSEQPPISAWGPLHRGDAGPHGLLPMYAKQEGPRLSTHLPTCHTVASGDEQLQPVRFLLGAASHY